MYRKERGFTLIEILIVIAVIGVLTATVLSALRSARTDAKIAAAHETAKSAQLTALLCLTEVVNLNDPNGGPPSTIEVCDLRGGQLDPVWPDLPVGWVYDAGADLNVVDDNFQFTISHPDEGAIQCDNESCVEL